MEASDARQRLGLVVLLGAALLVACGPAATPAPTGGAAAPAAAAPASSAPASQPAAASAPTAAALSRIRVAYSSYSPAFLPHFVAESLGYYQRYGLESESVQANPAVSIPGLVANEIDYVLSIGSLTRAAAKGVPVRVLAVHARKPNFFLVVRPEIRSGTDLRGKAVGMQGPGGNSHQTMQLYMSALGLDPQDVQYLALGEESVLFESLKLGRVEAVPLSPPYPAQAEREGMRVLATPDDLTIEYPFTGVGASVDKIAHQRDQAKNTLKAQLDALQALQNDREAVVRVLVDKFALEPAIAEATFDQIRSSWGTDGAVPRDGIETLLRLDIEAGALTEMVPYESIVDASVLNEARAELRR